MHLSELPSPLGDILHDYRKGSGSIGGEHRRDLKEAVIGAPQNAHSLSVPIAAAPTDAKPATTERKRGL